MNDGIKFGCCSPVGLQCEDFIIQLEDLATTDDIQLLQKFHNQTFMTPEELIQLDYLDLYLDIPSICYNLLKPYLGLRELKMNSLKSTDRELLKKFFMYIQHRFHSKQHIFLPHDIDRLLVLDNLFDIPIIRVWYYQMIEIDFDQRYNALHRLSHPDSVRDTSISLEIQDSSTSNLSKFQDSSTNLLLSKTELTLHRIEKASSVDNQFANRAIYRDHLNVFVMCYDPVNANKYNMDCRAAEFGRTDMLRHMYSLGYQFSTKTSEEAAKNNEYGTLLFLHSVHCPWEYKLHWSNINLFIFLYHNIREWSIPLLKRALIYNNCGIIDYAIEQKDTTFNLLLWTIKRDTKEKIDFILNLCSSKSKWLTPQVMQAAIQKQQKWIVKRLLLKKCPTNSQCYHEAIYALRPDLVSLLYKSGCPLDSTCYQINPLKRRMFSMMKVMREYPKISKLLQKYKCPYQGSADLPNRLKVFHTVMK